MERRNIRGERRRGFIKKDLFRDGKSSLSVWMEDEDGKLVENSTLEKEIKVDTIAPQFEMTASAGFAVWYQRSKASCKRNG